ncbi:MAG TPA: HAMP domain-containing sensor histidine kinase [Thermotogota bacterium]|nr:HAMP domain-containing sensor histidine kinase [Thermotogota bacterium]
MKSMAFKWTLSVVLLMASLICAIFLANTFFLESYFEARTLERFTKEYHRLLEAFRAPDREFLERLRQRNAQTGFKFLVVDDRGKVLLSTVPEFQAGAPVALNREQEDFLRRSLEQLKAGKIVSESMKRASGEGFDIVLAGPLESDKFLLVTLPLELIRENTALANRFLLFIGSAFLLLGVITAILLSRRTVHPILQINRIASSIAKLDFSERYTGKEKDEVGTLGKSINHISDELSHTISRLQEANNELHRQMHLQKNFFTSVTHEFKTPVGLIRGYAESLQLGLAHTPEQAGEFSDIIIHEADRLTRLIEDILLMARLDSTGFELKKTTFDLVELIGRTVEKRRLLPGGIDLPVTLRLPVHCTVEADEGRISQVLDNLLANAVAHCSPSGHLSITLEQGTGGVRVEVFNSGAPIPSDLLEHLFEPFGTAQPESLRKKNSTGLGLSIVKSIVEKHGGSCGIHNVEGGVVAWYRLPFWREKDGG